MVRFKYQTRARQQAPPAVKTDADKPTGLARLSSLARREARAADIDDNTIRSASVWQRIKARVLDLLLLCFANLVVIIFISDYWSRDGNLNSTADESVGLALLFWIGSYGLMFGLYSFWLYPKASVGQSWFQLAVVRADTDKAGQPVWRLLNDTDLTLRSRFIYGMRGVLVGFLLFPLVAIPMLLFGSFNSKRKITRLLRADRGRRQGGWWWHDRLTGFGIHKPTGRESQPQ